MTIAHVGVAVVAGLVGSNWQGRTTEGVICACLIYISITPKIISNLRFLYTLLRNIVGTDCVDSSA